MTKGIITLIAFILVLFTNLFAQNKSGLKSINNNAPVKCSKTITIIAKSEKVWLVITDIDNWSKWQTDITNAKLEGGLKPTSNFVWKTGGAKVHSTLHTVEPFKYFGWTGKTYGMYAIHNWSFEEINGQTKVTVNESMEGFLAKVFKKSFNKNLENGMQNWLELLKKESEK